MKLLKQKTTNEIYVFTPELAKRPDMEPYEREAAPQPVVVPPESIPAESPDEDIKKIAQAVLKKRKTK